MASLVTVVSRLNIVSMALLVASLAIGAMIGIISCSSKARSRTVST